MDSDRNSAPGEERPALAGGRSPESPDPNPPIAIVGMACRFPGARGLSAFWSLLEAGGNAVQQGVPGSGVGRLGMLFPSDTGQIDACRFGAYLDDLERFDAAFFRISPVEANLLDPQQRLILETGWRALEDAGIDPEGLRDSRTGVYAGISNNDYRGLILEASEQAGPAEPAASLYAVTGTSLNTAIGRVAFALGLGGPALAVDTACSSSLVATHLAVTGLQRGDADLALAGGVNIVLSGRLLEFRANAGMLSPDGQCKAFDASANGYVRGEGCGIVVLKRLADAEADGDRIWGVIRGTALNQDGASPGLTVPNGAAQQRVIAAALERAGVRPSDIDYLEAHGTGTEVGDPIEIDAIAAVYGRGRGADNPLLVGSVKTNIGHLESAGRGRRTDQDRAGDESGHHSPAPALPQSEPGDGLGAAAAAGDVRADVVAGRYRPPAAGRRQRFRLVGHERPRGAGGIWPARRSRAGPGRGPLGRRRAPAGRRFTAWLRRAVGGGRRAGPAHDASAAAFREVRRRASRPGGALSRMARP